MKKKLSLTIEPAKNRNQIKVPKMHEMRRLPAWKMLQALIEDNKGRQVQSETWKKNRDAIKDIRRQFEQIKPSVVSLALHRRGFGKIEYTNSFPILSTSPDLSGLNNRMRKAILDHLRQQLREYRAERIHYNRHTDRNETSNLVLRSRGQSGDGRFMDELALRTPGWAVAKLQTKLYAMTREIKAPRTNDLQVGIEIEFVSPLSQDAIRSLMVSTRVAKWCQIKTDGSVRNQDDTGCCCVARENKALECVCRESYGHELAVLCLETEYKLVLKKVCQFLKQANAVVNKSCGVHVHIDCRNVDVRNPHTVYTRLCEALPVLTKFVPRSRLDNQYCKNNLTSISAADRANWATVQRIDRYRAINGASYPKYKTIEVRMHSGSTNYRKLVNWVELLLAVTNTPATYVATADNNPSDLYAHIATHGTELRKDLREYLSARARKFTSKAGERTEERDYFEVVDEIEEQVA